MVGIEQSKLRKPPIFGLESEPFIWEVRQKTDAHSGRSL
jgi:hypothetical protein